MKINDQDLALNPDLFASEVHFCLLNDGVRSSALRRLWRVAKGNSELERILEIKVSEFRRSLREERTPSLWNLPSRTLEWLSEHARFTPPREALSTMAYVAFVLVVIDVAKSRMPWDQLLSRDSAMARTHQSLKINSSFDPDADLSGLSTASAAPEPASKVDEWLAKELQRAAESTNWEQSLSRHIAASFDKVQLDALLEQKLAGVMQSYFATDEFKKLAANQLQQTIVADEFQQQLKSSVTNAAESTVSVQKMTQNLLASEEFKKGIVAAMTPAADPAIGKDAPPAVVAEETNQ